MSDWRSHARSNFGSENLRKIDQGISGIMAMLAEDPVESDVFLFACSAYIPQTGKRIFFTTADFGEGERLDLEELAGEYAFDAEDRPGILENIMRIPVFLNPHAMKTNICSPSE